MNESTARVAMDTLAVQMDEVWNKYIFFKDRYGTHDGRTRSFLHQHHVLFAEWVRAVHRYNVINNERGDI